MLSVDRPHFGMENSAADESWEIDGSHDGRFPTDEQIGVGAGIFMGGFGLSDAHLNAGLGAGFQDRLEDFFTLMQKAYLNGYFIYINIFGLFTCHDEVWL